MRVEMNKPTRPIKKAGPAGGAVEKVRSAEFPIVLRGYDRRAVDAHLAEVTQLVAELEATQLRQTVVQRALDEVGEQTSAILQRAHETSEEIAARSRAQAEGRIQRAEHEAEVTRREAESDVERLRTELRRIWAEREKLIEEVRALADEVLAVADDALDRMPGPPGEPEEEDQAPEAGAEEDLEDEPDGQATVEVAAAEPETSSDGRPEST
jgi:DivIVA domain-containing protein